MGKKNERGMGDRGMGRGFIGGCAFCWITFSLVYFPADVLMLSWKTDQTGVEPELKSWFGSTDSGVRDEVSFSDMKKVCETWNSVVFILAVPRWEEDEMR